MPAYTLPQTPRPPKLKKKQVQLVANGDLRAHGQPEVLARAGEDGRRRCGRAVAEQGYELVRAHPYKEAEGHGFIGSQKEGMEVFANIDPDAPLIVAEAVWQYSHHVLHGLIDAPRADPHRRQLVGHLAGPRRHAQPQRLAHQGRRRILDHLERGLHRRFLPRLPAPTGSRRARPSTRPTHVTKWKDVEDRRARSGSSARPSPRSSSARRRSWASSTRGAWACSTRSSPTTCSTPPASSRSASASRPSTTKRRRSPTKKPAACASGWKSAA